VLGDVMVDVVARLSGPVAVGSDSAASVSFRGGGSAANVAAWLAFAGERPVLVGRVGEDERGASAVAELRESGVETRLAVDTERSTGTCVVLVAPGGERSMLPDPGANAALRATDLADDVLAAGSHLHVAGYALVRPGPRAAALSAIARATAAGMTVSVDPSSAALLTPEFLALAGGAGLLVPNAEEAAALTGEREPSAGARRLAQHFPEVVVKLGAEGALWTNGSDEVRVPAAAGSTGAGLDTTGGGVDTTGGGVLDTTGAGGLDTTGAGDAFAAGLLAARLGGAEPAEALAAGCELAAQAVVTPGARPPAAAP
jgi:sugar/nucleoside kinase (ribokinase family)